MNFKNRRYNLGIWILALGYFVFYLPYSALIKIITTGPLPGTRASITGFELLPATVIATAITMPLIITLMGWWKYAGRRQVFGFSIPFPSRWTFLSGLATAIIIGTTTLAYTFRGVSIVLALLLLRGGVLIIAPVVDAMFKRKVRWFSWTALALSFVALVLALADVTNYTMTVIAALNVMAYLGGYALRIPLMTKLAKSADENTARRYIVEEQLVAMPILVAVPAIFAIIGSGDIMIELRSGFTTFFASIAIGPALLIGCFYACLYMFGTLIYLDRRENTFCVPLNRCSSLLSGLAASYALVLFYKQPSPSVLQVTGAGLIIVAILFLSPLHHTLSFYLGKLKRLTKGQAIAPRAALQRVFLFVCSGNTSRSPIAHAICNREIARRLGVQLEALKESNVRAISAGITATAGTPITLEAEDALRHLGVTGFFHKSQNLTAEIVQQAEVIFCMTQDQLRKVVGMFPSAAGKTRCLDPEGDIEDPGGAGAEVYAACARRIESLIYQRLDEVGIAVNA